jgi:hypothetical protein
MFGRGQTTVPEPDAGAQFADDPEATKDAVDAVGLPATASVSATVAEPWVRVLPPLFRIVSL